MRFLNYFTVANTHWECFCRRGAYFRKETESFVRPLFGVYMSVYILLCVYNMIFSRMIPCFTSSSAA